MATKEELDFSSQQSLRSFVAQTAGAAELLEKAEAILIFPAIFKAGFGVGAEYGEGGLILKGHATPDSYYSIVSVSTGFQVGIQEKSVMFVFMSDKALADFLASPGWKVGVDANVTVIAIGAGVSLDTSQLENPVMAFIFDQKGLMYNLTVEGSKITRLAK